MPSRAPDSPAQAFPAPLAEPERIRSLDILRGVAVLGIFAMNIRDFALPIQEFDNAAFPTPPLRASDLWAWGLTNLLFEDKMIAIFSILFGAGILTMAARSPRPTLIHYRRMFWLFLIGLAHAFGLWYGDILNTYAICGAIIFPLRRLRPALLIALGVALLTSAVWFRVAPAMSASLSPPAPQAQSAPHPESASDRIWRESLRDEHAAYRGSWLDLARWRARLNIVWHWYGCISFNFERCAGFMLIGMGLIQLGILSASRPAPFYASLLIAAYALGALLVALGMWPQLLRALGHVPDASPEARRILASAAWSLRSTAAGFIAIGHIALVMLLCRARAFSTLLHPLAAAGRMALSNYLLQTLIAVALFDPWAGHQWGAWRMTQLYTLVPAVWLAQLILSPIWLRFFRFGPAEWLWRSLTYWRPQPFRA